MGRFSALPPKEWIFSTTTKGVDAGAIRVEIEDSRRWNVGDVAILQNQEARTFSFIGSLVFEQPLQNDYPASTEVKHRSQNSSSE